MLDLKGKMTPHEFMIKLERVPGDMTLDEMAQFVLYLRDEAYDNKLQLSPVTVGYLADIAYALASPSKKEGWEKSVAALLGAKGGASRSEAKIKAVRENGKKGGRPKPTK